MSLVPFEPFRHLDNMKRDLERFLSDGFPNFRSGIENLGTYKNGVLEVRMPKVKQEPQRRIDVDFQ